MEPHGQIPFSSYQQDMSRTAELSLNVIRWLIALVLQLLG